MLWRTPIVKAQENRFPVYFLKSKHSTSILPSFIKTDRTTRLSHIIDSTRSTRSCSSSLYQFILSLFLNYAMELLSFVFILLVTALTSSFELVDIAIAYRKAPRETLDRERNKGSICCLCLPPPSLQSYVSRSFFLAPFLTNFFPTRMFRFISSRTTNMFVFQTISSVNSGGGLIPD